jgi:hypothetical protein
MQKDVPYLTGLLQVALTCSGNLFRYLTVQTTGFGVPMPPDTWVQFSGTIDTSMVPNCNPVGSPPGMVSAATLFLNQSGGMLPFPDLYIDDVVVQVTDGHNLVGNPNFEAGFADGWTANGATIAVSSTVSSGGTHSLSATGRTLTSSGPTYALPTALARYNVTFPILHTGSSSHGFALQATYNCAGGSPIVTLPFASAAAVPPKTWTKLSGTVTLPPPDAPAGCRMIQPTTVSVTQQELGTCTVAGGSLECPDLYIDDVSITLAP